MPSPQSKNFQVVNSTTLFAAFFPCVLFLVLPNSFRLYATNICSYVNISRNFLIFGLWAILQCRSQERQWMDASINVKIVHLSMYLDIFIFAFFNFPFPRVASFWIVMITKIAAIRTIKQPFFEFKFLTMKMPCK